jgi:cell division initiation protein
MSLTPLDIRKMTFPQKLRGLDPQEVESFLFLVAEELAVRLGDVARLEQENREMSRRLDDAARRQQELQEALLHAQKLSKNITDNAKHEADLLVREAQVTADTIVTQAIEQANRIESRINDLRTRRRDLQIKFRNTLDSYREMLEAEMEDERSTAVVHTLPRRQLG